MTTKAPSFSGLKPASASSSYSKRNNPPTDTQHELLLRRELWRMGLRFRKNVRQLLGKPDLVFASARVVVFCDGDFWHGRNWKSLRSKLSQGANASYWLAKIESNMSRDNRNKALLEAAGWQVIRVWETDISRNPSAVANSIRSAVDDRIRSASESRQRRVRAS
jgi:DNA mismatch endonuclease, patch repair protein